MTAFFAIIPLSFFNPEVRRRPLIIIEALSHAGLTFSRLLMAIAVVGIVVAVLGATGLPKDFVVLIDVSGGSLFLTLLLTGLAALMLGMGMPTLPAYLTIVLILGPAMQNLGLTVLAAHLFVLYYAVALYNTAGGGCRLCRRIHCRGAAHPYRHDGAPGRVGAREYDE